MGHKIQAACLCNVGLRRRNNEDNFFFNGNLLDEENNGLSQPLCMTVSETDGLSMAVFDGMGGENFGETAAYAAARAMAEMKPDRQKFWVSTKKQLLRLVNCLNDAVVAEARVHCTDRMGCTMVSLHFEGNNIYVCNLGDSRAYCLRGKKFTQLSRDHVSTRPMKAGQKPPLIQHLGIDPEEMIIEPFIIKNHIRKGDRYLLCSDGLTDMVSNEEIADIIANCADAGECVCNLVQKAIEHGGRDNITVIVCMT